jgi:hypothetical protein
MTGRTDYSAGGQMFLPTVGDLIQVIVAWRKGKADSKDRIRVSLTEVSTELDALAEQWIDIASTLQRSPTDIQLNDISERRWKQRSHFEALRVFCEYLQSGELKAKSEEMKNLERLITGALNAKGEMLSLVTTVFMPGEPHLETCFSPADARQVVRTRIENNANAKIDDGSLSKVDKILARRAQWAKSGIEKEFQQDEDNEKMIKEEAMKRLGESVEQLSGLAGEFRAAVRIIAIQ